MHGLEPGALVVPFAEPRFPIARSYAELRIFEQLQRQTRPPCGGFELCVNGLVAKLVSAGENQRLVRVVAPQQDRIAIGDSHGDEVHRLGREPRLDVIPN